MEGFLIGIVGFGGCRFSFLKDTLCASVVTVMLVCAGGGDRRRQVLQSIYIYMQVWVPE